MHDGEALQRAMGAARDAGVELSREDRGLLLAGNGMELRVDLADEAARLAPGKLSRELLVRAAKVKRSGGAPSAVDACAGLGTDGLLLAASGFEVVLFERDPVIAALLADALERARASAEPALKDAAARMELIEGDSIAGLSTLGFRPDVVYLDPMFPERKKSAAVKKKFQLLHCLERPCTEPEALLAAAKAARPRKIVIKRPAKGPYLAGEKPSYSLSGKAVRYDVIALPPDAS